MQCTKAKYSFSTLQHQNIIYTMLSVTFYYREPRKTGFSIEGIFHLVEHCLKNKIAINNFYCNADLYRIQNTLNSRKYSSDINHITGDVQFLAMGLLGKKTILTIHDFGFYENSPHSKFIKTIYKFFWYYLPLKCVNYVTVISEYTKEKLLTYYNFPENRIKVIYNPVKPIFKFSKKETPRTNPTILILGAAKNKNLINLIEASKNTNFHLDIVGWPGEIELEKLYNYSIAHTITNGLTDEEVYKKYIDCDILYFASLDEGFGMPIIEAQAVGRPVITSNIGAMKEIGGGSAILVDPYKPDEIKNAILSLSNKEFYDETVAKGIINAARFNYELISEQYLNLYKELAADNK